MPEYPKPVKHLSNICYGVDYFDSSLKAKIAGEIVRKRGDTFNGGLFDGLPCGRDKQRDHIDPETGKKLYAVTTR